MREPDEELGKEDFHTMMRRSLRHHPNMQPVEGNFLNSFAQKLLRYIRIICHLDFYDDKTSRSFVSPHKSDPQKRYPREGLPMSSKCLKYFVIYYGIFKLMIMYTLLSNMDMKWYNLKKLLVNCSGLDPSGKFVHDLDPGPLLMNNDPFNMKLHVGESPVYSNRTLQRNEYHCHQSSAKKVTNRVIETLQVEFLKARKSLKFVGSSLMNKNFPIECCTIFAIVITTMTYVLPLLLLRLDKPIDFSLMRMFLAIDSESWNNFELVRQQVNIFIRSSREFAYINWHRMTDIWYTDLKPTEAVDKISNNGKRDELCRLTKSKGKSYSLRTTRNKEVHEVAMLDHYKTVEHLKRLALSGELQPLNKTKSKIEQNIRAFSLIMITLTILSITFGLVTVDVATRIFLNAEYKFEWDPLDIIFHIESTILIFVTSHSSMFLISYSIINCFDQLDYAHELCELIRGCKKRIMARQSSKVDSIGAKFELTERPADGLEMWNSTRALVKSNLLCTLMRYKIFVAQFQPIRKSFSVVSGIGLIMFMVVPLVARIYHNYLDLNVRNITAACSFCFSLATDLLFVPLCQLNFRCGHLYRELSGLLAHSVEIFQSNGNRGCLDGTTENENSYETCKEVNNNQVLWLLRKELHYPEQMVNKFNVSLCGLKISYANMLKIHFYFGIIVLPTVLDDHSRQGGRHVWSLL